MIGPGPGRVELKFAVPEHVATEVLSCAALFLDPDVHAVHQRVTSLYLDTPQRTFLRWHRAQRSDRFKLRVRRYGNSDLLYAEVKSKTHSMVRKQRAAFPMTALPTVLERATVQPKEVDGAERDRLQEFMCRRLLFAAVPQVLVSGMRQSLRGRDPEHENAVTIDRDLQFQPMEEARMCGSPDAWRPLPTPACLGGTALVEVKYGRQRPAWMATLLARLEPWRVSFSKYVAAMSAIEWWRQS